MTFGPSSSLERIGVEALWNRDEACGRSWSCGVGEIDIPDSVRELGDRCLRSGIAASRGARVSVICVMAASRGARVCAV